MGTYTYAAAFCSQAEKCPLPDDHFQAKQLYAYLTRYTTTTS